MNVEAVALIAALAAQTVALGFAGGKIWQLVKQHDRYLFGENGISHWRHDHVTPRLYKLDELWRDAGKGD